MEISSQQDLERKMAGLRNEVQVQKVLICVVMMLSFVDKPYQCSFIVSILYLFWGV